jgi:hypothetical protein
MFLGGGFSRLGLNADASGDVAAAARYGIAAASMVFIFTSTFGATWLTVPWLYPAEIFPLAVRAKGSAWGVVGWSIGNGWLVSLFFLLIPVHQLLNQGPIDSAASHLLRQNWRKNLLPVWHRQRDQHSYRLGLLPRVKPTDPRGNGSSVRLRLAVQLGSRGELC